MVDVLTGENMNIRLDFYGVQHGRLIYVKFTFGGVGSGWTFNPANIMAETHRGRTTLAKGFRCGRAIADLDCLRYAPSIEMPKPVRRNDCYMLFIDHQEPGEDTITMNIDNALTLNGRNAGIPVVYFKRNPGFRE